MCSGRRPLKMACYIFGHPPLSMVEAAMGFYNCSPEERVHSMLCVSRGSIFALALSSFVVVSHPLLADSLVARECQDGSVRGSLVDVSEMATLSVDMLDARLSPYGLKAKNGVKLFKLIYNTVTPNAAACMIQASALVAVPETDVAAYPWIMQQHFTIIGDREAPTASPFEGLFEASQGFFTIVPDNLGYGSANGVYPTYLFAKGYAETGVDALRAAKNFADTVRVHLGPLFLKGYSEGGYATLALQQSLETEHEGEFPLAGSAPSAGPYDTNSFRLAFGQDTIGSVFLNHVVFSYEQWLSPKLAVDDMYQMDLPTLRGLYSGAYISTEIRPQLPMETKRLFKAAFVDDMRLASAQTEQARVFQQDLSENSLPQGSWTPKSPTRFFHCADDDVVSSMMTEVTVAKILAKNAAAPVSKLILASPDSEHPYTHLTCPLYFSALAYFGEIMALSHPVP